MVTFHCIFLFFIYFNVGFCDRPRVNKVTTTKYPFNAMVFAFDMHKHKLLNHGGLGCSGVIVRKDLVLTAASCLYFIRVTYAANAFSQVYYNISPLYRLIYYLMYGKNPAEYVDGYEFVMVRVHQLEVYVGADQPMETNPLSVKKVHVHPQYQHEMPYYDLAVLQLKSEMVFSLFIKPIKSAMNENYYAFNNSGLLTGYGQTEENQQMVTRHLHSVRAIIASPESCDQESNKDSTQRNTIRRIYDSSRLIDRRIFCAKVREGDEGMCQGWHIGSAFTVGKGEDRRLIGIASTPNICPNSGAVIITSVQGMSNWYNNVE